MELMDSLTLDIRKFSACSFLDLSFSALRVGLDCVSCETTQEARSCPHSSVLADVTDPPQPSHTESVCSRPRPPAAESTGQTWAAEVFHLFCILLCLNRKVVAIIFKLVTSLKAPDVWFP